MRFFPHFGGIATVALLLTLPICACGQKGPLYLRDKPPPGVKPERPTPYKPVPYPPDEPREGQ
ncbi:MAG TPA: lipoprotein [Burkholderiales bacterium]|nr:lipoprotein [Burkholderiales bacterium]